MLFEDFTSKILKDIIKKYELHYIDEFKGYSKMGKAELVNKIKKHLYIENDLIKQKKTGSGLREDARADLKKIEMSSNKEDNLIKFVKKYPQLGFTESKIVGLIDRKPWREIERILFDAVLGLSGGGSSGYALHAVLVRSSVPFETAEMEARHIIKKKKFFHRMTKNHHRFRNIPKGHFESKTFRSKKINKDITLVFGKLKPKYIHLEGSGFFDWIKSGFEKVKNLFSVPDNYNNTSKKTLDEYGNLPIVKIAIYRTPINTTLNSALNFISLGKWNDLRKKYGFDKLFHLALVITVNKNGVNKNIIVEKNETVNVSTTYKTNNETETIDIPLNNKNYTILEMLEKTRNKVGNNKFFDYDAFKNNCQNFIKMVLEENGLYGQKEKDFLFQDIEALVKELPEYVKVITKGITKSGLAFSKITGQGDNQVIMKPEVFFDEHNRLIGLLTDSAKKLQNEANEQKQEINKLKGSKVIKMDAKDYKLEHDKLLQMFAEIVGKLQNEAKIQANEPDYKKLSGGKMTGGLGNVSLIKEIRSKLVKKLKEKMRILLNSAEYKANNPDGVRELKYIKYFVDSSFWGHFDRNSDEYIQQIENLGTRTIMERLRKITNPIREERKQLITARAILNFGEATNRISHMALWNSNGLDGFNETLKNELYDIIRETVMASDNSETYMRLVNQVVNESQAQRARTASLDREIENLQTQMGELEDRMDTLTEGQYLEEANALRDRYRELLSQRPTGQGKNYIANLPKIK